MPQVRIVHFSDLHSRAIELPKADVYVCTGDMAPNWPTVDQDRGVGMFSRYIDKGKEHRLQTEWFAARGAEGFYRSKFGSPQAPVVCVRGNHDFADLAPAFSGGTVHEVQVPEETFQLYGLNFGGFRGIREVSPFHEWSDEMDPAELSQLAGRVPLDVDVLVTHVPCGGILDDYDGENLGCYGIGNMINVREYGGSRRLMAHMFGHIHERRGVLRVGEVVFSNAATGFNVIDLEVP